MNIKNILNFIIALLIITSCNIQKGKDALLPSVTGKAGEVILVMENDYWESKIGEKWKEICAENVPGLPQMEPVFNLIRIPKKAFTSIFKTHRNVIFMKLDKTTDSTKLLIQEDIYARPQILITISSPNKNDYYSFLSENKQRITEIILGAERRRIINNYKKYEERKIRKQLKEKHSLSLRIPKGYTLDVDSENFVWIAHETPYISQGLFIYYYNYTDTAQLQKNSLITKRNEILKKFVPGSLPGSYMTTDTVYPLNYDQFYLKEKYIAELKGLWRTEKDFMGGPFLSFTTVDEKRNRIVTVDAYTYSPKFDKRNYMRQLEAILFTLEIN